MIWWPTSVPTLRYGRVTLRPLEEKDIESIYHACQDPMIPRFTTVPTPYTMSHAQFFVLEQEPSRFAAKSELIFAITRTGKEIDGEDEDFCGVISFHSINHNNHVAEIGYWLAKPFRRQGVGTTATKLLTDYGLQSVGFRRIEALVDVENEASKALLLAAGYKLEGILRQKVTRSDGQQIDMAVFSKISE